MIDRMTEYANERSGDFRDMQRVEAACRRWKRDIPYLKYASYGRYAPVFCRGRTPGIDLCSYSGSKEDFYRDISEILSRRFYQPESRRKYLGALRRFLNWLTIPLDKVTAKCMYAYTYDLLKTGMKPRTYTLHISALRTIFDSICDLEVTSTLTLPRLENSCELKSSASDTILNKSEIERVLSYNHSVRDRALFATLCLLDLKLNEVLNLRKKDISLKEKTMKIWSGLGRHEEVVEFPDILSGYLCKRMDEIGENDYLFSRSSNTSLPLSGKGVNWILKKMLNVVGISKKVSCKKLLMNEIKGDDVIKKFAPSFHIEKSDKTLKFNSDSRVAGHLNIEIGELVERNRVVSADIKVILKSQNSENIVLKKISVSEFGSNGAKVKYPSVENWNEELIWITREERERLVDKGFKAGLSQVILHKYEEKRKICYIRKERIYSHWKKIG